MMTPTKYTCATFKISQNGKEVKTQQKNDHSDLSVFPAAPRRSTLARDCRPWSVSRLLVPDSHTSEISKEKGWPKILHEIRHRGVLSWQFA